MALWGYTNGPQGSARRSDILSAYIDPYSLRVLGSHMNRWTHLDHSPTRERRRRREFASRILTAVARLVSRRLPEDAQPEHVVGAVADTLATLIERLEPGPQAALIDYLAAALGEIERTSPVVGLRAILVDEFIVEGWSDTGDIHLKHRVTNRYIAIGHDEYRGLFLFDPSGDPMDGTQFSWFKKIQDGLDWGRGRPNGTRKGEPL